MSTQPETTAVTAQPETTVATTTTKGKANTPRGKNWMADKDIQLCKSWIHISEDPITGDDQNLKRFWGRHPRAQELYFIRFKQRFNLRHWVRSRCFRKSFKLLEWLKYPKLNLETCPIK
ncbi:hypothetical protein BD770DRAFT_416837 [Pilaira anomala]|nr:hypothetical protein BD770DRAFT_416837 [Pilaira anomala]